MTGPGGGEGASWDMMVGLLWCLFIYRNVFVYVMSDLWYRCSYRDLGSPLSVSLSPCGCRFLRGSSTGSSRLGSEAVRVRPKRINTSIFAFLSPASLLLLLLLLSATLNANVSTRCLYVFSDSAFFSLSCRLNTRGFPRTCDLS